MKTQLRCWLCGLETSRTNPRLDSLTTLAGIPGCYLRGESRNSFCHKCWSRLFVPSDGSLPPIFGWAIISTKFDAEVRKEHCIAPPAERCRLCSHRAASDALASIRRGVAVISGELDRIEKELSR
ncbi:MAG: hypothetical protein NT105_23835 [Verrucomicrobia bacterium]|nr:hypothetical protein [Verrucomicrobiota bacterium]